MAWEAVALKLEIEKSVKSSTFPNNRKKLDFSSFEGAIIVFSLQKLSTMSFMCLGKDITPYPPKTGVVNLGTWGFSFLQLF